MYNAMYMYIITGETLWARLQEGLQYQFLIKEKGNHYTIVVNKLYGIPTTDE